MQSKFESATIGTVHNLFLYTTFSVYIRISNEHSLACLTDFIQTLSCSSEITFLSESDTSPPGCAVAIVNSRCEVHLLLQVSSCKSLFQFFFFFATRSVLKGLIDVSKEMSKLQSKRQDISRKLESLRSKTQMNEYKTKVPLNVQTQDESKVCFSICCFYNLLVCYERQLVKS